MTHPIPQPGVNGPTTGPSSTPSPSAQAPPTGPDPNEPLDNGGTLLNAAANAEQNVVDDASALKKIAEDVKEFADVLTRINRVVSRWVHWWTNPGNAMRGIGGIVGGILIILALGMLVGVTKDLGEGDS